MTQRTGPRDLHEPTTRLIAKLDMNDPQFDADDCALIAACRAAVAEWDAEPQPAETIAVELPADVHRRFAHDVYTPRDVDAVQAAAAVALRETTS